MTRINLHNGNKKIKQQLKIPLKRMRRNNRSNCKRMSNNFRRKNVDSSDLSSDTSKRVHRISLTNKMLMGKAPTRMQVDLSWEVTKAAQACQTFCSQTSRSRLQERMKMKLVRLICHSVVT
jgi:hypothetical protein